MQHHRLSFGLTFAIAMLAILGACGGGGGGSTSGGSSSSSSSSASSLPVVTGYLPGSDIAVNITPGGLNDDAHVVVLTNGTIAVAWQATPTSGASGKLYVRLFNASGTAFPSVIAVDASNAKTQWAPRLAALANGNFVLTWAETNETGGDTDGASIKAQIFDSSGTAVGSRLGVNTTVAQNQYNPAISPLSNGGFVILWLDSDYSFGNLSQRRVMGQVFTAAGVKSGSEKTVNAHMSRYLGYVSVAGLSGGGFIAVWHDESGTLGDMDKFSVHGQMFDASGAVSGAEFRVNTQTALDQASPDVLALVNGGYVVTWTDYGTQLGGGRTSAKGQMYSAAGAATGAEFAFAASLPGSDQIGTSGTGLANGSFLAGWMEQGAHFSTRGQVFDQTGSKFGANFTFPASPADNVRMDLAPLSTGGFVAVWSELEGTTSQIKMRIFAAQ